MLGVAQTSSPREVSCPSPASVADQFPDGAFGIVGDTIGFTVDELTGDTMRAHWNVVPAVHQPHGILHGGIHAWIHETVASVAATVWFGDKGYVVGVSNQTDFFRAVREGRDDDDRHAAAPRPLPAGVGRGDPRRRRPADRARSGAAAEHGRPRLSARQDHGSQRSR